MSFIANLLKWKIARWSPDGTGLVGLSGNAVRMPQTDDPSLPILCIGGDHPYAQWWGAANDGMGKMYRDYGVTPYLAINTAEAYPGSSDDYISWDQLKVLQAGGVEVLGHSHRHVHQYGRMDTGIQIVYSGASGTATVNIAGSPKTLTLAAGGGAENAAFDLTNASYDTLAKLKIAIDGTTNWTCTLAAELTGAERATCMLALVAARSVKAGGQPTYFCAGGGIIISYVGSVYRTAVVQVTTVPGLDIYLDGVRKLSYALSNASYDTLAELSAAITAGGVTGLTSNLCDETAGIYTRYTTGDEISLELALTQGLDITSSGGVVLDGSGKANGARVSAGLPHSYLIQRQWQANKDSCAANGVIINNWAQSGGGLHQWHLAGHSVFRSYRTNGPEYNRFPTAHWATLGPDYIRGHYVLDSTINSKDCVKAAIRAMTKSRGCMVDLLCHALVAAAPPGVNGYTLPVSTSLNTMPEADWIAILAYIKTLVDAGSLVVLTPEGARRRRKWSAEPQNLVFNSTLENDGTVTTGIASLDTYIPGWRLTTTGNVTAASMVDHTDYNGILITTNSNANSDILSCVLAMQRGKTYRIGMSVQITDYTAGNNGVQFVLSPIEGQLPGQRSENASPILDSIWARPDATQKLVTVDVSMLVAIPAGAGFKPRVKGLVGGTFNIGAGTTDTLAITLDANSAVTVTLTAGGARTATQIVADINAAFAASATYTSKQEYWAPAHIENNKVVVESPYVSDDYSYKILITGNGAATVFGGSQCISAPTYGQGNQLPLQMTVRGQMQGKFEITKPYCLEVNTAY